MRWPKSRRADAATDIDSVDETPARTVQTATVKETNESEAIAALGESDRDDQPMPSRRRIRWSRMIAYGVLPGLALLLALAAGFLKWQDNSVRDANVFREQSVRAATDSTIALLSYRPDTVQKDLEIQEYTDPYHDPMIPHTRVLKPGLVIHSVYNGYWFWGRPSIEELWRDLRQATREIRPHWDLSASGLREAWDAGDRSRFYRDADVDPSLRAA